jgi:hypothetical protein
MSEVGFARKYLVPGDVIVWKNKHCIVTETFREYSEFSKENLHKVRILATCNKGDSANHFVTNNTASFERPSMLEVWTDCAVLDEVSSWVLRLSHYVQEIGIRLSSNIPNQFLDQFLESLSLSPRIGKVILFGPSSERDCNKNDSSKILCWVSSSKITDFHIIAAQNSYSGYNFFLRVFQEKYCLNYTNPISPLNRSK